MKALTLARGDLRLTMRDRSSIFWIFIAPFLWVYFFGFLATGSDPARTRVSLLVNRLDPGEMAGRFIDDLRAQNFKLVVIGPGEPVPSGDDAPTRSLTIPAGFADSIARREKVSIDLAENENANPEGTLAVRVALHKAIVRLLAGEALSGLDPAHDLVTLSSSWAGSRIPTGYYQSIPGNLVMFVLLSTLTYGAALLSQERRNGILRRLGASSMTRTEIIAGKLLGRATVAAVQVAIFVLIGLLIFRIQWGSSPAALALLLSTFVLCAAAIGLLGGTLFASPQAASGIGVTVSLVMSAIGGCWWPSEVMPAWLRSAGWALPTSWAVNGLHEVISWGGGLRDILPHCAVITLIGVAAFVIAARRLRFSD